MFIIFIIVVLFDYSDILFCIYLFLLNVAYRFINKGKLQNTFCQDILVL